MDSFPNLFIIINSNNLIFRESIFNYVKAEWNFGLWMKEKRPKKFKNPYCFSSRAHVDEFLKRRDVEILDLSLEELKLEVTLLFME